MSKYRVLVIHKEKRDVFIPQKLMFFIFWIDMRTEGVKQKFDTLKTAIQKIKSEVGQSIQVKQATGTNSHRSFLVSFKYIFGAR